MNPNNNDSIIPNNHNQKILFEKLSDDININSPENYKMISNKTSFINDVSPIESHRFKDSNLKEEKTSTREIKFESNYTNHKTGFE